MLSSRGLYTSRRIYSVWKASRGGLQLDISGFKELSHRPTSKDYMYFNRVNNIWRWGGNEVISSSATRYWQERRTSTHVSSSISQITHMVFVDTVSNYPSTDLVLISGKTSSVKGSSVLATVFLSMSSMPPRLTPSRSTSMLTGSGRPSDMDKESACWSPQQQE